MSFCRSKVLVLQALSSSGSMRSFSTGLPTLVAKQNSSAKKPSESGLVQESTAGDITDQIPHIVRPMGVVEGTSYGALILGGLAFAGIPVGLLLGSEIHTEAVCDRHQQF